MSTLKNRTHPLRTSPVRDPVFRFASLIFEPFQLDYLNSIAQPNSAQDEFCNSITTAHCASTRSASVIRSSDSLDRCQGRQCRSGCRHGPSSRASSSSPRCPPTRRRRQAEMLKNAKELRTASGGKAGGALKKRFWKDVTVQEVDGKQLALNPATIAY
jgi:hypothetical protein